MHKYIHIHKHTLKCNIYIEIRYFADPTRLKPYSIHEGEGEGKQREMEYVSDYQTQHRRVMSCVGQGQSLQS